MIEATPQTNCIACDAPTSMALCDRCHERQSLKEQVKAQAQQIATLQGEITQFTATVAALRKVLRRVLPKLAHRAECMKMVPSEEWSERGRWEATHCKCIISVVGVALESTTLGDVLLAELAETKVLVKLATECVSFKGFQADSDQEVEALRSFLDDRRRSMAALSQSESGK